MFTRVMPALPDWAFGMAMSPIMKTMAERMTGFERVDFFKWDGGKKGI